MNVKKPLIFVKYFCIENNVFFEFHLFVFYVKDIKTNEVHISGRSKDDLYVLSKSFAMSLPQFLLSVSMSSSAIV